MAGRGQETDPGPDQAGSAGQPRQLQLRDRLRCQPHSKTRLRSHPVQREARLRGELPEDS